MKLVKEDQLVYRNALTFALKRLWNKRLEGIMMVIEYGSHENLLALNSKFAKLFNMQAERYT